MEEEKKKQTRKKRKISSRSWYKRAILEILSVCGEMTPRAIRMIRGNDHKRYIALSEMISYGWVKKDATPIRIRYNKGYRNEKRARYCLDNIKAGYEYYGKFVEPNYEDFISAKQKIQTGQGSSHRKFLELSEVLVMMYNVGIKITSPPKLAECEKPQLYISQFVRQEFKDTPMEERQALLNIPKENIEIMHARFDGLLSTPNRNYLFYDLGKQSRMTLHDFSESVVHMFANAKQGKAEKLSDVSRLYFVYNLDLLYDIMYTTWVKKEQGNRGEYVSTEKNMIEGWHQNTYIFPKSHEAELMLNLLVNAGVENINRTLCERHELKAYHEGLNTICDAYEEVDGKYEYHLQMVAPNVNRLRSYIDVARLREQMEGYDTKFYVHCFKEYADAIETFRLPDNFYIIEEDVNEWIIDLMF